MNLPRFFRDNDNLGGIGTVRWMNNPLAKPGVKTFVYLFPAVALELSYVGGTQVYQCSLE